MSQTWGGLTVVVDTNKRFQTFEGSFNLRLHIIGLHNSIFHIV